MLRGPSNPPLGGRGGFKKNKKARTKKGYISKIVFLLPFLEHCLDSLHFSLAHLFATSLDALHLTLADYYPATVKKTKVSMFSSLDEGPPISWHDFLIVWDLVHEPFLPEHCHWQQHSP